MNILTFGGYLGLGGTEKAACRWAIGLKARGHDVRVLAISEGPRKEELSRAGIPVFCCPWEVGSIAKIIAGLNIILKTKATAIIPSPTPKPTSLAI